MSVLKGMEFLANEKKNQKNPTAECSSYPRIAVVGDSVRYI